MTPDMKIWASELLWTALIYGLSSVIVLASLAFGVALVRAAINGELK
jgi:hypothetical protein